MQVAELPAEVFTFGLSRRKVNIVRRFASGRRVTPVSHCRNLANGSTLFLWGSTPVPADCHSSVRVVRLEDGFLRSVGLGADLVRPLSWVLDDQGIYYDATRPSELEYLLGSTLFTSELCDQAACLRERLVSSRLTKYNIGSTPWRRPTGAQRIILVPGQVESDASLAFGAPGIKSNLELLKAVRKAVPDAWIMYKSHPDVAAGLRRRGDGEDQADQWSDEQVPNVSMGELLEQVDEVHTMTSLTGFEALLRGRLVTCYGQPFYAGWGLTTDLVPVKRRTRHLTLNELVAGALLVYPTYFSRETGTVVTIDQALDELQVWRERSGSQFPWWRRCLRVFLRIIAPK